MEFARWCLIALLMLAGPEVRAVVVAGANGGGNTSNNTTAAQMAMQLMQVPSTSVGPTP
jgi:hypothetical protein